MGRMVDVTDLVGAAEIAERLGLAHTQSLHTMRHRHPEFPAPVVSLKRAHVWSWADVETWAVATGRLAAKGGS